MTSLRLSASSALLFIADPGGPSFAQWAENLDGNPTTCVIIVQELARAERANRQTPPMAINVLSRNNLAVCSRAHSAAVRGQVMCKAAIHRAQKRRRRASSRHRETTHPHPKKEKSATGSNSIPRVQQRRCDIPLCRCGGLVFSME